LLNSTGRGYWSSSGVCLYCLECMLSWD